MSYHKIKQFFFLFLLISIFSVIDTQTGSKCNLTTNKLIQCNPQAFGTYLTCIPGIETPHKVTRCPHDTPYCNIGRYEDYCSDILEASGTECYQIGAFSCTKPGFYPNVMDCNSYFYCNGDYSTVTPRFCPPGFYFNTRSLTCIRQINKNQCYTPKCDKTGNLPYQPNAQFFYSCSESESSLLIPEIHRCDAKEIFRNDECRYLCWIAGRFVHEDPTRYYECYPNGPRLTYVIRSCGTKTFNPKLKRCEY